MLLGSLPSDFVLKLCRSLRRHLRTNIKIGIKIFSSSLKTVLCALLVIMKLIISFANLSEIVHFYYIYVTVLVIDFFVYTYFI